MALVSSRPRGLAATVRTELLTPYIYSVLKGASDIREPGDDYTVLSLDQSSKVLLRRGTLIPWFTGPPIDI